MYDSDDETYAMKKQREAASDAEAAYYRQKGKKRRKKGDGDDDEGECVWCQSCAFIQVARSYKTRFDAAKTRARARRRTAGKEARGVPHEASIKRTVLLRTEVSRTIPFDSQAAGSLNRARPSREIGDIV